ncbi:MAG: hypothetical protein MZV49_19050 [Rhodopseudomonas palustris]|nr:hypothetical protein [Rhodopseudomonas palustris]
MRPQWQRLLRRFPKWSPMPMPRWRNRAAPRPTPRQRLNPSLHSPKPRWWPPTSSMSLIARPARNAPPQHGTAAIAQPAAGTGTLWDKTSLIGKIFIAFGALLTAASAARLAIA